MMSPTGRIARTIFSEEHEAFRDSVRRFIAKEITPYHARWEKDGIVPRSAWKAAGEAGLLGIAMPEAYGGLGLDRRFVAVMIRSEEHTSELQSLMRISYAVFCLKQKKQK